MSNKLQGKDFINIGIFTVIYFVVTSVVAMLGVIPVFIPLLCVFVPLIGGIPMMLYFSKIRKFGMLTITGGLDGVLLLFTGMGYWCILTGLVFGVIADFMLKSSGYKKVKMETPSGYTSMRKKQRGTVEIIAHGVFSISVVGAFLPIILTRNSYYETLLAYGRQEYADALMNCMPAFTRVCTSAYFRYFRLSANAGRCDAFIFQSEFCGGIFCCYNHNGQRAGCSYGTVTYSQTGYDSNGCHVPLFPYNDGGMG